MVWMKSENLAWAKDWDFSLYDGSRVYIERRIGKLVWMKNWVFSLSE